MKRMGLTRLEKILLTAFCVLLLIALGGTILLIKGKKEAVPEKDTTGETPVLADKTIYMPDNCNLYEKIPDFSFNDENGKKCTISDFEGKNVIVTFWASWCSDCKEEMPYVNAFQKVVDSQENTVWILIDKLDGEKESKEAARDYLAQQEITIPSYYDENMTAYEQLGLHNIPTTLFIDEKGRVKACCPKQITSEQVFTSYVKDLTEGSDVQTCQFLKTQMMNEAGGVRSSYTDEKKGEVLSESQGVLLEYAVTCENKELFDTTWSYIEKYLMTDGLCAWKTSDGKKSEVNALIDDFRIYAAMQKADQLWGGYTENVEKLQTKLQKYAISKGKYVDCYDAEKKQYSNRLTLCYADVSTMKQLAGKNKNFKKGYKSAVKILEKGYISNDFPLYYSWYDYEKKEYGKDELNAAEAMVTLLHLAEEGKLKEETHQWLCRQMNAEGIKARYTVDGEVVEGYNYDSTAVYALVAMIGNQLEDYELRGKALQKMEQMRIRDTGLSYNAAFGMEDGSGITSFDQLMPMLAYAYAEKS